MITNFGLPQNLTLTWAINLVSQLKTYFNSVISKDEAAPYITLLSPSQSAYQISVGDDGHLVSSLQPGKGTMSPTTFIINVTDTLYGAVGDDSTDNTTAITTAIADIPAVGGVLYFPRGIYRMAPETISAKFGLTIKGDGPEVSVLSLTTTGNLLTLSNCNFVSIQDLGFKLNGTAQAITTTTGILLNSNTGNTKITRCNFRGFADSGVYAQGVASTGELSGNDIIDCYFLGNGGKQFHGFYNHDFTISGNQFGIENGVATASHGMYLDHCNAGIVTKNKVWSSTINLYGTNSHYNQITDNRITQARQQNISLTASSFALIEGNEIYSGSQQTDKTYSNVVIDASDDCQFLSNKIYSWDATSSKWGVEFTNTCNRATVMGNQVSGFDATNFGPYFISTATANANFTPDRFASHSTAAAMAVSANKFIGVNAEQAASANTPIYLGTRYQFAFCEILITSSPGVGTNTFTLNKSGTNTGETSTITGSNFGTTIMHATPPTLFSNQDYACINAVIGGTATDTGVRYAMALLAR